MAGKLTLGIVIGASLASGFASTFKTLNAKIGDTQKNLNNSKVGQALASNVIEYKQKLATLARQQKQFGNANVQLWQKTAKGYAKATRAAEKYGINVGDVVRQHRLLGDSASVAERKLHRLNTLQNNRNKRADLQGKLVTTVGLAYSAAAPLKAAIEFESVMADVNKVVDFDSPAQFKTMQKDILALSTVIPMAASGLGDIMVQAGQAGIAKNELLRFAEDAAKMGVAFDMAGKEAGSAMTGLRTLFHLNQDDVVSLGDTYNHLSNNMDATARDMVNIATRAGATATMFGLNGKQVGALGATFLAMKTPAEIAGRSMNAMMLKLATADKQGGQFQDALANIGMSAGDLKQAIEEDGEGALISFLEAVKNSDDVLGNLSDLFGLEYSDDIAKLVDGLEGYKKAVALAGDETATAGSMLKEYQVRSKTTANEIQLFRNQINKMGVTIGSVLLPALRSTLGFMGRQISTLADLSDRYPQVTKVIVGAAVGLVTFKVVALAAGYAATILSDGWIFAKGVFDFFRLSTLRVNAALIANKAIVVGAAIKQGVLATATGAATAAQWVWNTALVTSSKSILLNTGRVVWSKAVMLGAATATGVVTAAQWLWNAALTANPIGLVIAGVAALAGAAYLIWDNWEPIAEFFSSLWDGITEKAGAALDWILDKFSAVSDIWNGLFGDDEEKTIKTVVDTDNVVAFPQPDDSSKRRTNTRRIPLELPLPDQVKPVVNTDNVVAFPQPDGLSKRRTNTSRIPLELPLPKQTALAGNDDAFTPLELPKKVANGRDIPAPIPANQTNHISIQIQQRSGENANDLAERVATIIERQKSADSRGALYD